MPVSITAPLVRKTEGSLIMSIINMITLNLLLTPCSMLITPIPQSCHLQSCTVLQSEQPNELHDYRSRILACAWQNAVEAVPTGKKMGKHGKGFVTVAEAVMCDSVPLWWSREIQSAMTGPEHLVSFRCRRLKNAWHQNLDGVDFSGVDELEIRDDGLHLESKGASFLVPKASLEDQLDSTNLADAGAFACCITEKYVVVGMFCPTEFFGNPKSFVCINRESGMLNWTGQLDQHLTSALGSSGGVQYAYTEIIANESIIAVYSASEIAVSLQCFNADTGVKELTFLSNRSK